MTERITEENRSYIKALRVSDVPWHRLTTVYGRATAFPEYFAVLEEMRDADSVREAFEELGYNVEHQDTLWHATPFASVFLARILEKALRESAENPVAAYLAEQLTELFDCLLGCYHLGDTMEHAAPLPRFADLLREEYLWSEEYDEEADELRYEEEDVFPDALFYSFYYYTWQAVLAEREEIEAARTPALEAKLSKVLEAL